MRRCVAVLVAVLSACASTPIADPTPERPRYGCKVESVGDRSRGLVPARVRVVGTYPHDNSQWLIDDPDYREPIPIPKSEITFTGCTPDNPEGADHGTYPYPH